MKVGLKTFGEKIFITLNIINIIGGSTSLHFSLIHLIVGLTDLEIFYDFLISLNREAGTRINNDSFSYPNIAASPQDLDRKVID